MGKPAYFTRDATGLVRELGFWGTLGYLIGWTSFIGLYGSAMPTMAALAPGGNFLVALIIAWAIQIVTVVGYGYLSVSMPRSGGDYVWVSRTVHPALGFSIGWAWWIAALLFAAAGPFIAITFYLNPGLSLIGIATGNTFWSSLATTFSRPVNTLVLSAILTVIMAIPAILGLKWTVRVVSVCGIIAIAGFVPLVLILGGASSSQGASNFASLTGQNSSTVIGAAANAGFASQSFWIGTLAAVPIWMLFGIAGSQYVVYLGGEIKQVKRNLMLALIMNMLIMLAVFSIGTLVLFHSVGTNFYGALSYLWVTLSSKYPVPGGFAPTPQYVAYLINGNLGLTIFIMIASFLSILQSVLAYIPWISRVLFAMSFDRMLPSWMTDMNERFHAPLKVIAVAAIGIILVLPFWVYGYASTAVNTAIILTIFYTAGGLACLLLPFTKKSVFNSSAVNYRIGRIPVISLVGAIMIISWMSIFGVALVSPSLGVLGVPVYTFTAVLFFSGLAIYLGVGAYRRSRGLDVSKVYQEIPPE